MIFFHNISRRFLQRSGTILYAKPRFHSIPSLQIFDAVKINHNKVAIINNETGSSFKYSQLEFDAIDLGQRISKNLKYI